MARKRMAQIILHRKIPGEKSCICGENMKMSAWAGWVCPLQEREKEPSVIWIEVKHIKSDNGGVIKWQRTK